MSLRRYDLILLDIMLPGQDGLSLCGELRKITFCPIIFISCLNDDETVIRALNMGGMTILSSRFRPLHCWFVLRRNCVVIPCPAVKMTLPGSTAEVKSVNGNTLAVTTDVGLEKVIS